MGEKRYIISDASKMLGVESHVLRYWEEELNVVIPRNEMGHRYYTQKHINLLKNVKELKENGFQLKAIKMLVPEMLEGERLNLEMLVEHSTYSPVQVENDLDMTVCQEDDMEKSGSIENTELKEKDNVLTNLKADMHQQPMTKMEQFQAIIGNIVSQALRENNPALSKELGERVSDSVIKEMDYLMRMNQEKEEERFKKLDETIRSYQKERKEVAATKERKGFLFKKYRPGE